MLATRFVLAAMLPACAVGSDAAPPPTDVPGTADLATRTLAPGDVKTWTFTGTGETPGIDPRFEKTTVKFAKDVAFRQGATQQITLTATNERDGGKPGQADIQLQIADFPVAGAGPAYFKGWLQGKVTDSDNPAIGYCGAGPFDKGTFHAQLQLAFTGGATRGICYCNLCPATDGRSTWCATDQWQVGADHPPAVSASGACEAPAGTTHVVVTLEAVAKGDDTVHHHGTAVFQHIAVGRCLADGRCPDSMTPADYGN